MPRTETPLVVLVLEFLREHRRGTAPQIAAAIGRDAGLVNAALRKYEASGRVRRVGTEPNPLGRAAVIYELVDEGQEMVGVETNNGAGGVVAAPDTPEPVGPSAQELAAAGGTDELRADDMEELLAAYCGTLKLAETDSTTLLFVLRMRRVEDRLREVEASAGR